MSTSESDSVNSVGDEEPEGKKKEPPYEDIEHYLREGKYPDNMKNDAGKKKNFRVQCKRYSLIKNVLFYKYRQQLKVEKGPEFSRVIKNEAERKRLLMAAHEGLGESKESKALGGHIGRDKTLWKLVDSCVWWRMMNTQVREFVDTCKHCQKASTKMNKVAPELHPVPIPTKVWHQVGVDLCSLPKTAEGFVGICVVVDYFSKWMEAKPIRQKNAEEVALFLYELICRYGCTKIQINDQGREFCNKVSDRLHQLTGTRQRITSAYHPQANGLVERCNRTIQGGMLKVLQEEQSEWPKVLQGILFAFRTARQKSTNITPYEIMFNRKAVLPMSINDGNRENDISEEEADVSLEDCEFDADELRSHLKAMKEVHNIVLEEAAKNIRKAQKRQKADYNKRHCQQKTFSKGQKVLVYNLRRADRKGGKELMPYDGPYIVKSFNKGKGLYTLTTENGKELKTKQHGVNLKPFRERKIEQKDDDCDNNDEATDEEKCSDNDEHDDFQVDSDISQNEEEVECDHSNDSHNSDVQFFGMTEKDQSFKPTNTKWRNDKCLELGFQKPSIKDVRRIADFLGVPSKIDEIDGDGNCLFRAISKEVTLTEDHYPFFRSSAVSTLRLKKKEFEDLMGKSVETYLKESKMATDKVWGTDVELIALATFLNIPIAVHFKPEKASKPSWFFYNPIPIAKECHAHHVIYLMNPGVHYNRVISVK